MSMPGIPSEGFKTVGQIVATNTTQFREEDTASRAAIELLSSHLTGAPVVNDENKLLGFVSEIDILNAVEAGVDLNAITVTEIMNPENISVENTTSISEAHRLLEEKHILVLPVIQDGVVVKSITRHDLLRVYVGVGLSIE
ncbi:CBS domain-containing protein [Nitrospira sp. M1]